MATSEIKFRAWTVHVHRGGVSIELGEVHETSESNARCAALHKWGVVDATEMPAAAQGRFIAPEDDFDVTQRLA